MERTCYKSDGHPLHTIDILSAACKSNFWVLFIHGGSWRDPRNTSADGYYLLSHLPDLFHRASINYRLSPQVRHPSHLEDVWAAVQWLKQEKQMERFVLCGHSAGATLALQLASWIQKEEGAGGLAGIVTVGGLYDLTELVLEYPSYSGFIKEAFGEDEEIWKEASPVAFYPQDSSVPLCLVYSDGDELVTFNQTKLMMHILPGAKVERVEGSHEGVLSTDRFVSIVATMVQHVAYVPSSTSFPTQTYLFAK